MPHFYTDPNREIKDRCKNKNYFFFLTKNRNSKVKKIPQSAPFLIAYAFDVYIMKKILSYICGKRLMVGEMVNAG